MIEQGLKECQNKPSQVARPTGLWISLLSFTLAAFFFTTGLTGLWLLFRELYCRAYHKSAYILCYLCSYDFHTNGAIVFMGTPILYAIIHFGWLRRLSRHTHFVTLLSLVLLWALIQAARDFIPGKWEAWSKPRNQGRIIIGRDIIGTGSRPLSIYRTFSAQR